MPGSLVFFVLCSMISHPGLPAWYENERKGNKEDIAFIILARCLVNPEYFAKEMKRLKPQEETRWGVWPPKNRRSQDLAFSTGNTGRGGKREKKGEERQDEKEGCKLEEEGKGWRKEKRDRTKKKDANWKRRERGEERRREKREEECRLGEEGEGRRREKGKTFYSEISQKLAFDEL